MVGELPPLFQEFLGSSSLLKTKVQSTFNGSCRKSDQDIRKTPTFDVLLSRLSSEHPRVVDTNPLPYQSGHSPFGTESSMIMNPYTKSTTGLNGLLDTLMSTMTSERRTAERHPKLSPQVCEVLRLAYESMARIRESS
jgi:hypothetical protein